MIFYVLDIETRNHLQKDCQGDLQKLRLGLAGLLPVRGRRARFFTEATVAGLEIALRRADAILGFNLTGGFDYPVLENIGIDTSDLRRKTLDLMPYLITAFGSHKNFSLDNIAEHTLGRKKTRPARPRYKLATEDPAKLQELMQEELLLIRSLYRHIEAGKLVRFRTSLGLIDAHEVDLTLGQDCPPRETMVDPYDFPAAGMRLQIKRESRNDVCCPSCGRKWRVVSRSYYGDSMSETVACPACGSSLCEVPSNLMGPSPEVSAL